MGPFLICPCGTQCLNEGPLQKEGQSYRTAETNRNGRRLNEGPLQREGQLDLPAWTLPAGHLPQ